MRSKIFITIFAMSCLTACGQQAEKQDSVETKNITINVIKQPSEIKYQQETIKVSYNEKNVKTFFIGK